MISSIIVDILVRRILENGINPKTNTPLRLEDVAESYKEAVENELLLRTKALEN